MAIKEIKQHWIMTCDCCGTTMRQTGTHRPSRWVSIKIGADAVDYSGAAVADASRDLMLCDKCGPSIVAAMNLAANAQREAAAHG